MSCNNVQILNFNHNLVEISDNNKIIITDNNKCNSIVVPQQTTNILQINSPGPQGPPGTTNIVDTGSFATTGSNVFIGNQTISGSVIINNGITASLEGTSSWAINALTASHVLNIGLNGYTTTASFNSYTSSINLFSASIFIFTSSYNTGSFTGSFVGDGSRLINIPTQSFNTGSLLNTSSFNAFTGSVITTGSINITQSITGSLIISGSNIIITGSLGASNITGSLFGTSSWAIRAVSSSYSTTLAAGVTQSQSDQFQLVNSNGTPIDGLVTINNVNAAYNINGYSAANIDQINVGEISPETGSYAYIVRAEELEKSKHSTLNIFNFLNFT